MKLGVSTWAARLEQGEGTLATVADEVEISDAYGFQAPAADRRLSITMTLTPR